MLILTAVCFAVLHCTENANNSGASPIKLIFGYGSIKKVIFVTRKDDLDIQ